MKLNKILLLFLISFTSGFRLCIAQGLTASDALKAWDIATKMVVESAELMPSEFFNYTPGEPLRNFADQINHTTRSNIMFGKAAKSGKPTFSFDQSNPPQEKSEVIRLSKESFEYIRKGLAKLTDEDLSEKVPWGNSIEISRLKAFTYALNHVHSEHGKTIMYLRAKGIAPAPSGDWSFDFTNAKVKTPGLTNSDVLDAWRSAIDRYIACAKIMPSEYYSFTPFEPVRSFAEEINHISKSNIGFAKSVNGQNPDFAIPNPESPPLDKEDVIKLLESSSNYYTEALSLLSTEDLEAKVPWGRPGNEVMITRMKAVYIAISHLSREQGKVLMYLRAKGITPPN